MGLQGKWYNELGSAMELEVKGNLVSGTYYPAVGDALGHYAVAGATDAEALGANQAVGLVVAWVNEQGNAHSVTAWSGQLQVVDGEEILRTTWLLTRETEPNQDWQSTLIGTDTFTRRPPQHPPSRNGAEDS